MEFGSEITDVTMKWLHFLFAGIWTKSSFTTNCSFITPLLTGTGKIPNPEYFDKVVFCVSLMMSENVLSKYLFHFVSNAKAL